MDILHMFPSSFLRSHRRTRHITRMNKPKNSSSATSGSSAIGTAKKVSAPSRTTDGGWRCTEMREVDLRKLRESVLISKNKGDAILPDQEVIPHPPEGFRVMFFAFVVRGLSLPTHFVGFFFSMGFSFIICRPIVPLHLACFITLCE